MTHFEKMIEENVRLEVKFKIENQVRIQVRDQVFNQVRIQFWRQDATSQVRSHLHDTF